MSPLDATVATTLSKAPGAGEYFHGGLVTYTKQMKTAVLGVSMKLLKQKGAVCVEVAEAMAIGALTRNPAETSLLL
jgi:nicotinamide-nucleotide amidase